MKTKYLSSEERSQGKRHYLNWAVFNGLGFSFLGDTIVYLLAIHFGASNTQVGYLSSIVHVSGIVLLILPRLFADMNFIQLHFYAWLFRGLVCVGYGTLFFFSGQSAVVIILVVYTLFCLIRTFGVAVAAPIQHMLTTSSTTGELVVRISTRFQTTRLLSQFISFLLLSISSLSGVLGYLALMSFGIITNTIAAFHIRQVPCREKVEYRRGRNIFTMFRTSMHHRERALTLFAKWHMLSLMILFSFTIPYLRKLAHLPSNLIFLYTILGTLATISAGYLLRPFTDQIGSRPVLIIASFVLAGLAMFWSVVPGSSSWILFFLLGFLTTFVIAIIMLLTSRLELKSIPEKDKIGYVSMMNFFSAIVSLVVGLSGGMLADLGESIGFSGLNPYGLTFCLAAIFAMQNGVLCFFLEDPGSSSVKETAQILFSTRNLKAFLNIYQLNITRDPIKRTTMLLSIGKSDTVVAIDEIRRMLKNPLSSEKGELLKSLFAYPKPALLPELLLEASDEYSYQRQTAIFALGAYPDARTEALLFDLLDHASENIRSTAAKSLARIGHTESLPKVQRLAADPSLRLWARMNYLIAISRMDEHKRYLEQIFDMIPSDKGPSYEQTLFSLTAKTLDFKPPLAELYQDENTAETTGLYAFLEEAKQLKPFFHHAQPLMQGYAEGSYGDIWLWCRQVLENTNHHSQLHYLHQAIAQYNIQSASRDNTLAALYFTYQIAVETLTEGVKEQE